MNEKKVGEIIIEFSESGNSEYRESFEVTKHPEYIFNIKIERKRRKRKEEGRVYDGVSNESTISALPSGVACPRCNGSGRA